MNDDEIDTSQRRPATDLDDELAERARWVYALASNA
jgi:hypothetical protein